GGEEPAGRYRPIQVATDGYASSDACRACHPAEYAAWRGSFHRTMTQVANPRTVRASFDGVGVDTVSGGSMQLHRRGDGLWAEFEDPDRPDDHRRIDRQI